MYYISCQLYVYVLHSFTSLLHSACACVSWTLANLLPMHPAQDTTYVADMLLLLFCIEDDQYYEYSLTST